MPTAASISVSRWPPSRIDSLLHRPGSGRDRALLWASDPAEHLLVYDEAAQDHAAILAAIVAGDESAALAHCARETEALINAHLDVVMSEPVF